jgi:hypothetical protein
MNWISKSVVFLLASILIPCRIAVAQIDPIERMPQELQDSLRGCEEFTLLSLEPSMLPDLMEVLGIRTNSPPGTNNSPITEQFQGYRILGKARITAGDERAKLVAALAEGIEKGSALKNCFNPRHGIKATQGTNTIELLICFECGGVVVFRSGAPKKTFLTASQPKETYNNILLRKGVPVAE